MKDLVKAASTDWLINQLHHLCPIIESDDDGGRERAKNNLLMIRQCLAELSERVIRPQHDPPTHTTIGIALDKLKAHGNDQSNG